VSEISRVVQVKAEVVTHVPDHIRVVLDYQEGTKTFRVDVIEERILDGIYTTVMSGPIQTRVGRDHSGHRGHRFGPSPSGVPAELADVVLGADALRAMLREAGGGW
jgi:hypothetical protein